MRDLINTFRAHRAGLAARKVTLNELRGLTNRDLTDIGISRADFAAIGDQVYRDVRDARIAALSVSVPAGQAVAA